ncbi:MAG: hypothetical protein ACXITV_06185 [Luteibaculaceae bacterium]
MENRVNMRGSILFILLNFTAVMLTNCGDSNSTKSEDIKELTAEIKALREALLAQRIDTSNISLSSSVDEIPETRVEPLLPKPVDTLREKRSVQPRKIEPKKVDTVKVAPQTKIIQPKVSDTLWHYYQSGQVSVKRLPFVDGRRFVVLYDLKGEETVRFEDVRLSYSVSHQLRFGDNGEVTGIRISENPGAASFWFECNVTFTYPNQPSWMVCDKQPQMSAFSEDRKKYYWDKPSKTWKQQEIIREAPIDHLTR